MLTSIPDLLHLFLSEDQVYHAQRVIVPFTILMELVQAACVVSDLHMGRLLTQLTGLANVHAILLFISIIG
jgi:hypothetical protein